MAPASLYGHIVASAETICGVAFTAIMTGLMFVRFSRPKAKIIYADQAVIATHNGRPTLMVRIANGRFNVLTDALAQLIVLQAERSAEGVFFRRVYELRLTRATLPIFPLTWTLMHELDEQSPLNGLGPAELAAADLQLFLSVEAHDPVLAATVHDMKVYRTTDILFGMRYADAVFRDETHQAIADLSRISRTEPDIGPFRRTAYLARLIALQRKGRGGGLSAKPRTSGRAKEPLARIVAALVGKARHFVPFCVRSDRQFEQHPARVIDEQLPEPDDRITFSRSLLLVPRLKVKAAESTSTRGAAAEYGEFGSIIAKATASIGMSISGGSKGKTEHFLNRRYALRLKGEVRGAPPQPLVAEKTNQQRGRKLDATLERREFYGNK